MRDRTADARTAVVRNRTHPYRVAAAAARGALADMRTIYTPVTWTVGWLGRIIMQVIFFALIGSLLGSRESMIYLFIGQAVIATVTECFMSIPSTTWERRAGTLPLLVSAPGPLWPVFIGRSVQWLPSGIATGTIVLLVVGPAFGVTWSPVAAVVVPVTLAVVAVSMYGVALSLAAVVLRAPRWRNVTSNVAGLVVMLLSGATVPTSMWPAWLQAVGQALPVTHSLEAIRGLNEGADAGEVAAGLGIGLVIGLGWYVVAALGFSLVAEISRRDGTLDTEE